MLRPHATEREQVAAGLEDAQALLRPRQAGGQLVPLAAHEAEAVGRICHDGIHGRIRQGLQHVEAVPVVQDDALVLVIDRHLATSLSYGLVTFGSLASESMPHRGPVPV